MLALPVADVTQVAALVAAGTGLVAAIVGGINLAVTFFRDRPSLALFARQWSPDRHGQERYVEVFASNRGRRPITVVSMGLRLEEGSKSWKLDDGKAEPSLPARLEEGSTIVMTWFVDELGEDHHRGTARVVACFAVDSGGREVAQATSNL